MLLLAVAIVLLVEAWRWWVMDEIDQ